MGLWNWNCSGNCSGGCAKKNLCLCYGGIETSLAVGNKQPSMGLQKAVMLKNIKLKIFLNDTIWESQTVKHFIYFLYIYAVCQCQALDELPCWTGIPTKMRHGETPLRTQNPPEKQETYRYQETKPNREEISLYSLCESQKYQHIAYPIILWTARLQTNTPGPQHRSEQTWAVSCIAAPSPGDEEHLCSPCWDPHGAEMVFPFRGNLQCFELFCPHQPKIQKTGRNGNLSHFVLNRAL